MLLDVGMPFASWLGLALAAFVTLFGFLARDMYKRLNEKIDENKQKIEKVEEDAERELKIIDRRINDLHLNLLGRLDAIKDRFNELRK